MSPESEHLPEPQRERPCLRRRERVRRTISYQSRTEEPFENADSMLNEGASRNPVHVRRWMGNALAVLLVSLSPVRSEDLITCGWDAIRGWRITGTNAVNQWTWTAANSNLPDWAKPWFATTSDCKPCPAGRVLITSSGGDSLEGGVALIEPGSSNVVFYAHGTDAHSADLLPSNRLAVALSNDYDGTGNRLVVYDLAQSDVALFSVSLQGGHGVVWDQERQVLWVLSFPYLQVYALQDWNSLPQLHLLSTIALPSGNGHDMYPVPNSPDLVISTDAHCWLFDRNTRTFRKHPLLGDTPNIKGISVHPATGQIVYVQADTQWWTAWLRFLRPDKEIHFPGEHFYKARWFPRDLPPVSVFCTVTNTVVVYWPSTVTGFGVQQNTNLGTTNWIPPEGPINDDGTNKFLVVTPQAGQCFYRLIQD